MPAPLTALELARALALAAAHLAAIPGPERSYGAIQAAKVAAGVGR